MDEEAADLCFGLGKAQTALLDENAYRSFLEAYSFYERTGRTDKAVAVAAFPVLHLPLAQLAGLCERALALVPRGSLPEARILAKLALLRYWISADYESACRDFERILEVATHEDDTSLQMAIHANWSWVEATALNPANSYQRSLDALRLAGKAHDLRAEVGLLKRAFVGLRQAGRAQESLEYLQLFLQKAERLRERPLLRDALYFGTMCLSDRARWQEARSLSDRREAQIAPDEAALLRRALIERETGNDADAEMYVQRALAAVREHGEGTRGDTAFLLAWDAVRTGADTWVEEAGRHAREILSDSHNNPQVFERARWATSFLAVFRGDREQAAELYPVFRSQEPRGATQNQQRLLGLLSRTLGHMDQAVDHLERSVEQDRNERVTMLEAWDSYHLAETPLQRNGYGDGERAAGILAQTAETAGSHGMVLLERRVRELRAAVEGPAAYPDGLTHREVEVLRLIARGMTNKEIGFELYISPKTVNTHVQSILHKIGVCNRTEASTYAVRRGLARE